MEVRDDSGAPVLRSVDLVEDVYPGADNDIAPDMILGYNAGYRASWATVLGQMPKELLQDNLDRWSGTHLIAPDLVPGMLLSNRVIESSHPRITDLAPSILSLFGVTVPSHMRGVNLFS